MKFYVIFFLPAIIFIDDTSYYSRQKIKAKFLYGGIFVETAAGKAQYEVCKKVRGHQNPFFLKVYFLGSQGGWRLPADSY